MKKNILFLCTGNSCRSVLAEAYLNAAATNWRGFSAGSTPTGAVHEQAVATLAAHDIDASYVRSKSWDEFAAPQAPTMDVIITVCDNAAGEACPIWPGHPTTYHWPFPDPAKFIGSDTEKQQHFEAVFAMIKTRLDEFLASHDTPEE